MKLDYTVMNDYMFKEIFKHKHILCGYLNGYCRLNLKEEEIEVDSVEIKEGIAVKSSRFDIRIKSGKIGIDIEAQRKKITGYNKVGEYVTSDTYHTARKIHYASQLFSEMYKVGENYFDSKTVVALWFLEYELQGPSIQETMYCNVTTNERYENVRIIEISLKNALNDATIESEALSVLTAKDVSNYLNSKSQLVREVAKMIYDLNQDEHARKEAKLKEDNEKDLKAYVQMHEQIGLAKGLVQGKAQGLAEGLAQGKAQGLAEGKTQGSRETTLINAKKMKELGSSIEFIMEVTGLTKEEIEKL